jgi:hypothetical protein
VELAPAPLHDPDPGAPPSAARPPRETEVATVAERCTDYAESMKRGREQANRAEYTAAIRSFDDAVRARPFDAEARFERGRARYASGAPFLPDFEIARALTADKDLERRALIFIAHVQADAGNQESSRLALAIAAELGSTEAKSELGGRSTCTATWSTKNVPNASIVSSFSDALAQRQLVGCESDVEPTNESEARRELCRACERGAFDDKNPCSGPGPWIIPTGYMHCSMFQMLVQPLGGKRLYVDPSGGEPLVKHAAGWTLSLGEPGEFAWNTGDFSDDDDRVFNGVRWSTDRTDSSPTRCKIDGTSDVATRMSSGCQAAPGIQLVRPHVRRYFDKSGKALIEVSEHAGRVNVGIKAKSATLGGAGCHETIRL